ncbi:hypothetical protein M0R45_005070 [Rubus argutus]|uniref:Uncharacterized protein n=1 Tax=Rubus argutus TaxID=59490 RepID=A0AAW1YLM7_RUBAR
MPSSISLRVNYCPVEFKISPDGLLLLEEEDASNFQQHDQAKAVDDAAASISGTNQNQPAQDEDAEFDAREPHGEGFTTELSNDPAMPTDIPQNSEQGVEAVIQETPLFSKNSEHAEVMDLKEPVVTKKRQEAELGPIQHSNLIANEDKRLQLQAGSRSQRIAQIDAEMRRLQELRDKEVEMRDQEKKLADR